MKEQSSNELIFAKLEDKIKFCNTKNKITHTDFFTEPEIIKIEKFLKSKQIKNYFFFGGNNNSNRKMLFFYPEKMENLFLKDSASFQITTANQFLDIIRITLPNSIIGTFEHRDYLSAIMKLGIIREKFGDIIVYPEGADIIAQKENSNYFKTNLLELIRFKKANINIYDISEIHENTQEIEEISIIVNSMRIDNFIAEICHCSRNKAEEILLQEKVMINYETITKNSKQVNINDIITIRGFGRFIVKTNLKKTKSNKDVIILLHNK